MIYLLNLDTWLFLPFFFFYLELQKLRGDFGKREVKTERRRCRQNHLYWRWSPPANNREAASKAFVLFASHVLYNRFELTAEAESTRRRRPPLSELVPTLSKAIAELRRRIPSHAPIS